MSWESGSRRSLDMKALVAVLGFLFAGCASGGLIGAVPLVPDPTQAATVVVVRPYSILGSGRAPTITVDGLETYDLGPGEHVVMAVAPGDRILGIKIWEVVTWRTAVKIQAVAGHAYYFLMAWGPQFVEITENEGRAIMAKTTPVQDNAWKGQAERPDGSRQ
jgi:hypothetical protein